MGSLAGMSIRDIKNLCNDNASFFDFWFWISVYALMIATSASWFVETFGKPNWCPPTFFTVLLFIVWLRIAFGSIMDSIHFRNLEKTINGFSVEKCQEEMKKDL